MDALQAIGLVVVGEGDREWVRIVARLGDVRRHGEIDAQGIFPLVHLAGDVEIIADEGVVGLGDDLAIEPDRGDAIDIFERQRKVAIDIGLASGKAPFDPPGGLVHPHDRLLVVAEIGVGNLVRLEQGGVHVTRQGDAEFKLPEGGSQRIGARQVQLGIGCGAAWDDRLGGVCQALISSGKGRHPQRSDPICNRLHFNSLLSGSDPSSNGCRPWAKLAAHPHSSAVDT